MNYKFINLRNVTKHVLIKLGSDLIMKIERLKIKMETKKRENINRHKQEKKKKKKIMKRYLSSRLFKSIFTAFSNKIHKIKQS